MEWTGDELIVWGGYVFRGFGNEVAESDGFSFDASLRTWAPIADGPLEARIYAASAWTGEELLVWGGGTEQGTMFDDGAAYNPDTDSWRPLARSPLTARAPLSVWTGRELIVWGTRLRVAERPRDGAAYDPATDRWRSIAEGPIELTDAEAVWTGREMIVFGAALHGGNAAESPTAIGAAYDPATDRWRRSPRSELSPQASTVAWDGSEMIAWDYGNNSAAYDPLRHRWRTLSPVPLAAMECIPQSIATDRFVFGDYCGARALFDPKIDGWHEISRSRHLHWDFALAWADPVVLVIARSNERDKEAMFAYRPPSSRSLVRTAKGRARGLIRSFMERRIKQRGAFALVARAAHPRFRSGGDLFPMYREGLRDFAIEFVSDPLGGNFFEVGVRLDFENGGSYGHTYFVAQENGRYQVTGGRHGLDGP